MAVERLPAQRPAPASARNAPGTRPIVSHRRGATADGLSGATPGMSAWRTDASVRPLADMRTSAACRGARAALLLTTIWSVIGMACAGASFAQGVDVGGAAGTVVQTAGAAAAGAADGAQSGASAPEPVAPEPVAAPEPAAAPAAAAEPAAAPEPAAVAPKP